MGDLLTVNQVAELLDMNPRSIRTAIAAGRLPATKLSPRVMLIKREDVDKYKATPKAAGGRPRKAAPTPVQED